MTIDATHLVATAAGANLTIAFDLLQNTPYAVSLGDIGYAVQCLRDFAASLPRGMLA